jgi:hypothetical protein
MKIRKIVDIYLYVSIFVLIFGAVYEYFSFGVWSGFMVYAFAFPFFMGFIPCRIYEHIQIRKSPGSVPSVHGLLSSFATSLWACSAATLTLGSIFHGILNIYGTTNALGMWYWITGIDVGSAAIVLFMIAKAFPAAAPPLT